MVKEDRRILKTKIAIHDGFIALLAEKPFESITISDIANKANINRGTLYLHYTDKYDLLNQTMSCQLENMLKFCELARFKNKEFDLIDSLIPVFQYFEENYLFYSTMLTNNGVTCFHDQFSEVIRQKFKVQLAQGPEKKVEEQAVLIEFMTMAYVGVVEWWIKNNQPKTPEEMALQIKTIFESSPLFPL